VNLSPGRLVVLVALVVGGIAVMMNGFGDGGTTAAAPTESAGSSASETPGPTDGGSTSTTPPPSPEPQVEGVVIQVLNGTEATGLASQVDILLTGKGYVQGVAPADYENKPVAGTTVYFRTGDAADQNRVDAERLATKYLKDVEASVKALNDTLVPGIPSKVDLIVVLGEDYADAHPVA